MAEGGGEFGYKEGEQEVDTTHPFQPGGTSTPYQPGDPYHGGEQMEMSTFPHEQSGLPDTSYQEETLCFKEHLQSVIFKKKAICGKNSRKLLI